MCGIAGTIYSNNYLPGIEVIPEDLFSLLDKIEEGNAEASELLDLAWKYKSNINFLRYCKSYSEQKEIDSLCKKIFHYSGEKKKELPLIDKSSSIELYKEKVNEWENLVDANWFLSEELNKTTTLIETLSNSSLADLADAALILFRDITKIIHAIDNRLELRGRDSFGLSISVTSTHFNSDNKIDHINEEEKESVYYTKREGLETYSFVFKACSSIGGLGDNANELKRLISKNHFFIHLIKDCQVEAATIMGHTRWASIGEVNYANTHPVTLVDSSFADATFHTQTILNGDIYNYKNIISDIKNKYDLSTDDSLITSDCLAAAASLLGENNLTLERAARMSSDFTGSFAIGVQHSSCPEKVFLVKKGIQGLYLGFSYDGVLFASDVYGLVENCRYFVPVESDMAFELSANDLSSAQDLKINILNLHNNSYSKLKYEDLKITNITTRDIDKKNYKHFLEKEIYETRDIVERTLNSYLQPEKYISNESLSSAINISESQVPAFIVEKLKNREIKKVVITGMGTCYTAAVAISMYMRSALKIFIPDILVEPHIASEGSAFYLEDNMQDTLVIVIAQSGTTVDTNVYVQMAKDRGADSLAIANKREGDVTFIVDGTSYIGEGRDIEVAVPSTKTYTAQVVLGYIISLYLACNLAQSGSEKKRLRKDLANLRNLVNLIEDSFNTIENYSDFDKISNNALKYNSWYVLRDASTNSVCADEIRIKYSENCYHSVASITLSDAESLSVNNSFLTLITEDKISSLASRIKNLILRGNIITVISINGGESTKLQEYIDAGSLYLLQMPSSDKYFSFIPTILAGQFMSYFQAIELDKRTKYFTDLVDSLDSKEEFLESISRAGEALKAGYLNQGYCVNDLDKLHNNLEDYIRSDKSNKEALSNLKESTNRLAMLSRRTIDTIKHQAKTITVGAVRGSSEDNDRLYSSTLFTGAEQLESQVYIDSFEKLIDELALSFPIDIGFDLVENKELVLGYEGIDESLAYNVINHIKEYSRQIKSPQKIRLAQSYDYENQDDNDYKNWIFLTDGEKSHTSFPEGRPLIFDFNLWKPSNNISTYFNLTKESGSDINKSVWSFLLGLFLSRRLSFLNSSNIQKADTLIQKVDFDSLREINSLINALDHVEHSEPIKSQIAYASKAFMTRKNWKCIGSGSNYNIAKFSSKKLTKEMERACAFDVLENHKHIDMSAEASIFVFIAGIWKHGYQEDAISEIQKMIAHNSLSIIVTSEDDNRFDSFSLGILDENGNLKEMSVPTIKLPRVALEYAFPLNVLLLEKITANMKNLFQSQNTSLAQKVSMVNTSLELANANLWK